MADRLTEYLKKYGDTSPAQGSVSAPKQAGDPLSNYLNKYGTQTYYRSSGLGQTGSSTAAFDRYKALTQQNQKKAVSIYDEAKSNVGLRGLINRTNAASQESAANKQKVITANKGEDYSGWAVDEVSSANMYGGGPQGNTLLDAWRDMISNWRSGREAAKKRREEVTTAYKNKQDAEAQAAIAANPKAYEAQQKEQQAKQRQIDAWGRENGGWNASSLKKAQEIYDEADKKYKDITNGTAALDPTQDKEYQDYLSQAQEWGRRQVADGEWQSTDYDNYMREQEDIARQEYERRAMLGGSQRYYSDTELTAAARERERAAMVLDYAKQHQYDNLDKSEDFVTKADEGETAFREYQGRLFANEDDRAAYEQEMSAARDTADSMGLAGEERRTYLESIAADSYRNYQNRAANASQWDPRYNTAFQEPDERWTEEERRNFYYLFATDRERANQYGAEINQKYNAEEAAERDLRTEEFATRNVGTGALATAGAVAGHLLGGTYDFARMAAENAYRGDLYQTQYEGISRTGDVATSAIAQDLNNRWGTIDSGVPVLGGKGWGDVYQLFESMVESGASIYLAGGGIQGLEKVAEISSLASFFGMAASSGTRDALERGLDSDKAILTGFINGLAEVAGEKFSVENLLSNKGLSDFLTKGAFREILKQGGVEASEEVFTTLLNTMADQLINKNESELQAKIYAYTVNGLSPEEAKKKALKEWINQLGQDALGGLLSGSVMSGSHFGVRAAQTVPARLTQYQGNAQGLFDYADTVGTDNAADRAVREAADRYRQRFENTGKISNYGAARMMAATEASMRGEVENTSTRAERVRDAVEEAYGSVEEARKAIEQVKDESNTEAREKAVELAKTLGMYQTQENRTGLQQSTSAEQRAIDNVDRAVRALENRDQRERESALDWKDKPTTTKQDVMKDVQLEDGQTGTVTGAKYDSQSGKIQLTVRDASGNEQVLDRENLSQDAQYAFNILEDMLEPAQAVEAFNRMSADQNVTDYATAFRTVRELGQHSSKAFSDAVMRQAGNMTEEQARFAYSLGQGMTKREGGKPIRKFSIRGTGRVTFDGGKLDGKDLAPVSEKSRKANAQLIEAVQSTARVLGIDVRMFESQESVDGTLQGINGAYENGVIYLDINAGMRNINDLRGRMLFVTMAHELTHFIKENAPEQYQELQDRIVEYLQQDKGVDFNKLVQSKLARSSERLTYDGALEEVIADSCETMLRDSKAVQDLAERSPSLFNTIHDYIQRFLNKIMARHLEAKALEPHMKELQEIWDNALKAAVDNRSEAKKQYVDEQGTKSEDHVAEYTNDEGKTVGVVNEDNGRAMFSLSTYRNGGRDALTDFLDKRVKDKALTLAEARQIRSQIEELYRICDEYDNGHYAPFSAWSNAEVVTYDGRPVFSVVKANGEYKLNLDFSLVCKKRRTLDAVFNEMIAQGIMDDFDMVQESIAKINDIIRENGFETACGLCFVDFKRYRQGMIADAFVMMYNTQVSSLVRKGQKVDYFNYGGDQTIQNSGEGIDTLADDELDWRMVDNILKTAKPRTVKWEIANYLKNNPSARKRVKRGDFMSTAGFDALKANNQELLSLYNSKKGAGGPKAAQSDVQYLNEIINSTAFNPKAAYEVGGVRIQSFSDYVGRLVFDYIQMTADLAAKKLPAHSYTKEFMFAQQFGLTGIKINMSLVPEIIEGGVAPGLDANGNYAWKDGQSFGSTVYDNKGRRMTAAEGFELAKRIQNADGYSKNCGTIAVGVSDAHIFKMLDDPEIRMIIPYHKSSLNHIVAAMMNIDKYDDYTLQQNTRENKNGKWKNIPRGNEFNFNEALQRLGDAKAAANEYLKWCQDNGYKPKFDQFSTHENYYKLLEDYSCYDKDGKTNTPMGAVQMRFPGETDAFGSMKDLIAGGLEEDAILQAKQEKAVPEIVKQIQSVLPEFEGTVRERNAKKKAAKNGGAKMSERDGLVRSEVEAALWDAMSHGDKGHDNLISAGRMPRFVRNITGIDGELYLYRNHIFEDMVSEEDANALNRGNENAHFHDIGIEQMTKAIMSLENPLMSFSVWNRDGNPTMIALLPVYGKTGAPLYAVMSFYANKDINGSYTRKPHIVLTVAERAWESASEDGRASLSDVVQNAIVQNRVLSITDEMRAELSVKAKATSQGIITDSALMKNIAQFRKEINSFKQQNKINYSERDNARTDRELLMDTTGEELTAAERRELEKYRKKVEDFEERESKVQDALEELDRMVRAKDPNVQKQRSKVSNLQAGMNKALRELTESETKDKTMLQIIRKEREIQRLRTSMATRETFSKRELRGRITKLYNDLNRRITSPSEKKNIPVPVMMQAIDVLEAINMDHTRPNSTKGQPFRDKLEKIKLAYENIKTDPDYNDNQRAVYDEVVSGLLDNMIKVVGDTPINRMNSAQMQTVYDTLTALDKTARTALKVKMRGEERMAYQVAEEMAKETRSVKKPQTSKVQAWLNAQLSPERMFNRFGGYHKDSMWNQMYEMLNEGQLKQTRIQMEGSMIFDGLLDNKDYDKFVDPKHTVDIGLKDEDGNVISITHGMMVAVYLHLQNEQNARHVMDGGLTVPDLKAYYNGKDRAGVLAVGISQGIGKLREELRTADGDERIAIESQIETLRTAGKAYIEGLKKSIEENLTAYDRQWIAAAKELFDVYSKQRLNEATMEVYGIKRANVENYFPISVDRDYLNTPFETIINDMSLENAGFMKERTDSGAPIFLFDVSDIAKSQIRKVSQYAGLMPVIRNFNKVWGKTRIGYQDSLKNAVRNKFEKQGLDYIENLMSDLNGARRQKETAFGEVLNTLRGNMARASLTLSLRTAMGQAASYPTAASVIGWDPLRKALGHPKNRQQRQERAELIQKYSPLLWYRMKGYSTTELGDLAGNNSKFNRLWKKANWATGWIQGADVLTVGKLWDAAEIYVADNNKQLKRGTDDFYKETAKVFNDIVEKTQPDYTTMQRPDILRNPNALVRQLTMFMTQRLQNFNLVFDSVATYNQMKEDVKTGRATKQDVMNAQTTMLRTISAQLVAAATITVFKALADGLLHSLKNYRDDDEDLTPESVSIELLDMYLDSITGNVLGGGEAFDLIEKYAFGKTYYGIEVGSISTVADMLTSATKFFDNTVKGIQEGKKFTVKEIWDNGGGKLAKNISTTFGLPLANGEKIVVGMYHHAQDIINGEFLHFEAGVERTTAQQAHRLYRAYTAANFGTANRIREQVGDDKSLNKALTEHIKDQYKDGVITQSKAAEQLRRYAGKDAESAAKMMREFSAEVETGIKYANIADELTEGNLTKAEAVKMWQKYGGMDSANANSKAEYTVYKSENLNTVLESTNFYTYYTKFRSLMSPELYEDYYVGMKSCKGTDKNNDGKTDSGSVKAEKLLVINDLPLTSDQKDALFRLNGWSEKTLKDAPWHK